MQLFTDNIISDLLANDLETASIDFSTGKWSPNPSTPFFKGSSEGKYIKWHTFDNLEVRLVLRDTHNCNFISSYYKFTTVFYSSSSSSIHY